MEKKIKCYLKLFEEQSHAEMTPDEQEKLRTEMLLWISFFQHERLIHLIVTVTFAVLTVLSIIGSILTGSIALVLLTVLLLVLLVPYIRHYYILENDVQKMYDLLPGARKFD